MKRILFLITKAEIGGAQTIVASLARGYEKKGYKVTIGYGEEGTYFKETIPSIETKQFKHLSRSHNPFSSLLFIRELCRYIKKNSFDVVHMHSTNTLFGGKGVKKADKNIQTIYTFHGLSYLDAHHKAPTVIKYTYKLIHKILLRYIDTVVFVSNKNKEDAIKSNITKKGVVVYNGITTALLETELARKELETIAKKHIPRDACILGTIGRLAYPKNIELLITSLSKLKKNTTKEIFCIIIGDGPLLRQYKEIAKRHNVEDICLFTGSLSHAGNYVSAFDLFVMTSLYEGIPLTLLEAFQAGLGVLVPSVGGIPEILQDNDQLFSPQNKEEFVKKLTRLIEDPSLRNQKGNDNKKRSHLYTEEHMIESYTKLLN